MHSRSKTVWFCVVLLVGAGLLAGGLAALPFAALRAWVDRYAGDGSADPFTPALHGRLRIALAMTCLLCVTLAVGLLRSRRSKDWFGRIQSDARDLLLRFRALTAHLTVGLIAATVLAALLRLPYLDQPMRFDESFTYLHYASRPVVVLLARYDDPNNHVCHSLLVHAVTRILGDAPWAIRLPALAAGVLLAPTTMLLARAAAGRTAGWFAGLLTAASSPLIEYSTNARGYTLLALLTVVCWLLAVLLVRRENRLGWRLLGGGLALGAWTIPVMLYPAAMVLLWIGLCGLRADPARRREIRRGLLVTFAVGGALALLMYMPILLVSGPGILSGKRYVMVESWSGYVAGYRTSIGDAWSLLLRDVSVLPLLVLAIGLLYGAVSRRAALAPALATVLTCLLLTAIQRVHPPARVWLFLVPLAAVVVATGFAQMTESLTNGARCVAMTSLLLLAVAWPAVSCRLSESVLRSAETGVCPDARQIVALLAPRLAPRAPIISVSPVSAPLLYYADRAGLSREHFAPLDTYERPINSAIVVVSRVREQSLRDVLAELDAPSDLEPQKFEPIASFPSATVYHRTDATQD